MSEQEPENRLAENEDYLRLLMENVKDYAIFLTDLERRITRWNVGAERLLGYREEEVIGQSADIIFTPEDQKRGAPEKEIKTAQKQGRVEDERWHMRKGGERFWGSGILTPLYDEAGQLQGFVKIFRDFTERKRYQEQIELLNGRLRQAIIEMSNRVKNNLQLLISLIDMQATQGKESIPIEDLKLLSIHVRSLAAVHDLLMEQSQSEEARTVSTKEVLEKLLSLLNYAIGERALQFKVQDILLSGRQITSLALLANELVGYAVKHGKGEIEVAFIASEEQASLRLCSRGLKFAEDFDPRQDTNSELNVVEHLVQWDLMGQIKYDNLLENGACITVSFPLFSDPRQARRFLPS